MEKTEIEGNLVWQALKRKGAAGWFADGEDTLLEAMTSLTGSVIVGSPEAAPDGQGENHRITSLPGNLLKASDLLTGTRDREDSAQWDNAWPHRLRLYQCGPAGGPIDRSENGCREPSVTEATVNGMIQRGKDGLIGVRPYGAGTETVGLVQKFRLEEGTITGAEQAFMQYAPNGLGAGIRTLARYDEGMARLFVEQAAQQRNAQWAAEQTLFTRLVRPMMTFFEGLIFAITPLMAFPIALGPAGIAMTGKYLLFALWIQLWMPIMAIINLYLHRLLEGSPSVTGLLASTPFGDQPPHMLRVDLYRYRFTTREERAKTGNWWRRNTSDPSIRCRCSGNRLESVHRRPASERTMPLSVKW
jgi:hypothetical protein